MPKEKKIRLPKKLIPIPNPDKLFHERWNKKRDLLNIPAPYRISVIGPPNSGKSTVILNIILRATPTFQEIYIIHCDPENTQEYDNLGKENVTLTNIIPDPESWDSEKKKLCVIDDVELKSLNKEQAKNLDRLFGYVSTHKNVSVIISTQNFVNLPPIIRRCSNLWILFNMDDDVDLIALIGRRAGYKKDDFRYIFKNIKDKHDSIWIDKTDHSPMPLRLNGYIKL